MPRNGTSAVAHGDAESVIRAVANAGAEPVTFETGELAKRADGAVVVSCGQTVTLVTAVASPSIPPEIDYFSLRVEVEERLYAAGRIPGGAPRREGRPTDNAVLACRLTDRPLRPTFPKWFRHEVQIVATTLAADEAHPWDVHILTAASAALLLGGIPFAGPVAGVRLAHVAGEWVTNPTYAELEEATFELVVAGRVTTDGIRILGVEGGGFEHTVTRGEPPTEEIVAEGLHRAEAPLRELCRAQQALVEQATVPVREWERFTPTAEHVLEEARRDAVRSQILTSQRPDGRAPDELRPLHARAGILPRVHGSAVFERGDTQALSIVTLAMPRMEQRLYDLSPQETKRYMHHYNFPGFSVGEVGRMGTGRREIGHGALGEKALLPVIPDEGDFPYAIRVVSEILGSNGSTSMAATCASTLALMDAGVPIRDLVAGISIGLVSGGGRHLLLTDIAGEEDEFGDMDFKVAGTADMLTALQLDTKTSGLPVEVLVDALQHAKAARHKLLDVMRLELAGPRAELSPHAPRIMMETIDQDRIGMLIGPKGKTINDIAERTGAQIDVEDDGRVFIASEDAQAVQQALDIVRSIAKPQVFEVGQEFEGTVVSVVDFGTFVSLAPGRDGLVHKSRSRAALSVGQRVRVRVIDVRADGKLALDLVDPSRG